MLTTKSKLSMRLRGRGGQRVSSTSERGSIAVMSAAALVILIPFLFLALDLTRAYNRKVEIKNMADAVALAAARALDGTPQGLDKAVSDAAAAAGKFSYSYGNEVFDWSSDALKFGTSGDVDGTWMDASSAKSSSKTIVFAKVDFSGLDPKHGRVDNAFMVTSETTDVSAMAIAGRTAINITPLAICAMSPTPAVNVSGELVEFGFRRGVAYDLMRLNPNENTPENFLVNPIAPPGTTGQSVSGNLDVVGPFVCTGKMAIPNVTGGTVTVERPFPIASLYQHLNSRFGTVAACQQSSAPADPNVKEFTFSNLSVVNWMKYPAEGQRANEVMGSSSLGTVADPGNTPAGTTVFGPLWSYAKAAKYSSYLSSSGIEPSTGYATFATSDWGTLYFAGTAAVSYPSTTPYQSTGGAAAYKTYRNRRVLNIPLLQCPVPAGTKAQATVLGIGKFFMTVKADSAAVYAEFAGVALESSLGGEVEIFR